MDSLLFLIWYSTKGTKKKESTMNCQSIIFKYRKYEVKLLKELFIGQWKALFPSSYNADLK